MNAVVSDEGDHSGPVELAMDILDCLGDARVSSQVMVMMGVKDVQSDILIVGDIEQSLVGGETEQLSWCGDHVGWRQGGMLSRGRLHAVADPP